MAIVLLAGCGSSSGSGRVGPESGAGGAGTSGIGGGADAADSSETDGGGAAGSSGIDASADGDASSGEDAGGACSITAADGVCTTCSKSACCEVYSAFFALPNATLLLACDQACSPDANYADCMLACSAQYPAESAAKDKWVLCLGQQCSGPCYCAKHINGPACEACLAANCCQQYAAWDTAPNAIAYTKCRDECTDPACMSSCDQQYPAAAAASQALALCTQQACAPQCNI